MTKEKVTFFFELSKSNHKLNELLLTDFTQTIVIVDENKSYLANLSAEYWKLGLENRVFFLNFNYNNFLMIQEFVNIINIYCDEFYFFGDNKTWFDRLNCDLIDNSKVLPIFKTKIVANRNTKLSKLGILLIQFNAFELTKSCIESLLKTSFNCKSIYLLENSSKDFSSLKLFLEFKNLLVITAISRISYCQSFNILANFAIRAGCDYLFITNNDTKDFSKNIFEILIRNISKKVMLVSPKILDFTQRDIHWRPRYKFGVSFDLATEAYLVSSRIWTKIGGFNNNFIMYFEDLDLLLRVRSLGGEASLIDEVKLNHLGNGATRTQIFIPTFIYLRNLIWLQKNRKDRKGTDIIRYFALYALRKFKNSHFKDKPLIIFYILLAFIVGIIFNSDSFKRRDMYESLRRSHFEFKYLLK